MEVTNNLKNILTNFSLIYDTLIINPGNELRITNPTSTITAIAHVDVEFNLQCAISPITKLLSVISLFKKPNISFREMDLCVSETDRDDYVKYSYINIDNVRVKPIEGEFHSPPVLGTFNINKTQINQIKKGLSIFNKKTINFKSSDGKSSIATIEANSNATDGLYVDVDSKVLEDFSVFIQKEDFIMLPYDYDVDITKFCVVFKCKDIDLTYIIGNDMCNTNK